MKSLFYLEQKINMTNFKVMVLMYKIPLEKKSGVLFYFNKKNNNNITEL